MMRRRIDFIRDQERPSRLATLFMSATGASLLSAATILAWQQQGVTQSTLQLKERRALVTHQQEQQAQHQALMAARLSYLQDKRWKAALQQLNTPWFTVLGAIEASAEPPAFVMAARLDPERGSLELELVAPSFSEALQMVESLQQKPGLTQPRLVTREAPPPASTAGDSRFTIQAAWEGQAHVK